MHPLGAEVSVVLALLFSAQAGDWASYTVQDGMDVGLTRHGLGVDQAGRPHIVWAGHDTVHHAMLDGSWSVEPLVDPADIGSYAFHASLALRNQQLHVVWGEALGDDMWWARGQWDDWEIEPVSDFYTIDAQSPNIAIATDGTLQIADWDPGSYGSPEHLVLLRYNGTDWDRLVAPGASIEGSLPDLAFDGFGIPHYVWRAGSELRYTQGFLAEADPPTSFLVAPNRYNHAIAVDGDNRAVVAQHDGDEVKLYRLFGADWTEQVVDLAASPPYEPAVAVDPSGTVHLTYIDEVTLEVRHAVEQGPDLPWDIEVATHEFPGILSMWAGANDLHVAHLRNEILRHGHRDGSGTWSWQEVARSTIPGNGLAAVHDGSGVWIAHQDGEFGPGLITERLVLSWSDGTTATHEVLAQDDVYPDTELELGTDGLMRITRVDGNGQSGSEEHWDATLVLMTGTTGAWTELTASRPQDDPLTHALALDPTTDLAVVAYLTPDMDYRGDRLVLARQQTAGWVHEVISEAAADHDVAVDSTGAVHIGWRHAEHGTLLYSTDTNGTWSTEIVDDTLPSPVGGCGAEVAVAVAPNDTARLLYSCSWAMQDDEVRFARKVDGTWLKQVVAPGIAVGASLTIDVDGVDHAAVVTILPDALRVGNDASGAWAMEHVASPPWGRAVDLARSPDGELAVAWQDWARRDLVLALARPGLEVTPQSIDFGSVPLTTSEEQTVTLRNVGDTELSLPAPVLDGPHPDAFEVVGVCTTLDLGATCDLTVRFWPDEVLDRQALLRLAPGHEVQLMGTGMGVIDTSGCTDGSCGSCAAGGLGTSWAWPVLLLHLARRRAA